MPQPPHRCVKRPAHLLRRVLPRQQRADDAARRGKARPQAREGRIGTVRKQDKRCEQTGCVRPETAAAQHAPRAAPERCAHAEEHRRRKRKLHELRQPPQHQRREQHAKSQPARQPLARPALLGLLAAALRRQLRARAEHRRERRSVRADRPERHHEGIARALYAARDLTEADGRLVIRQACAAGRVAHEHRMHPRQPPQRAHDAHRAGAAVHARDAQDHVRHFCRRLS